MSLDEKIQRLEELITEVRQASLVDDKTSLGNALALRQHERQMNEGTSEFNVVVFGDLNDFKQINDEHSHDAGDVAINKAGETLQTIAEQQGSKAFRPSGDEFVILVKQGSLTKFLSVAPSLGNISFSHKEKELRTGMSLGYVLSDGKTSFGDLLERAEVACHHAKNQGEGVCTEWTKGMKTNPLLRLSARCTDCKARITCNIPKDTAPPKLMSCPCCGKSLS